MSKYPRSLFQSMGLEFFDRSFFDVARNEGKTFECEDCKGLKFFTEKSEIEGVDVCLSCKRIRDAQTPKDATENRSKKDN